MWSIEKNMRLFLQVKLDIILKYERIDDGIKIEVYWKCSNAKT